MANVQFLVSGSSRIFFFFLNTFYFLLHVIHVLPVDLNLSPCH